MKQRSLSSIQQNLPSDCQSSEWALGRNDIYKSNYNTADKKQPRPHLLYRDS